ncbi:MAG: cobalamin biosynthesis protein [Syntrophales bacterium]|nr:cobalamin biosynthesis protein [Syntrophales bacterium]
MTAEIFYLYERLIYIAPCGVVVRAVAGVLKDKYVDPAVVVVDGGGRYAVSLLSGHEGGANELAVAVANILGAEPVITTTTEALKSIIVGIGCRRGTSSDAIVSAIKDVIEQAGVELGEVRFLASAGIKADEAGLLEASRIMDIPVRFIPSAEIRRWEKAFDSSAFVKGKVDLPAVAVPAALLAGRRTSLIWPKTIYQGVTVALAREDFSWSASGPEIP